MKRARPRPASNGKPPAPPARPDEPCTVCHAARWWLSPGGEWLCQVCHPDPALLRAEWMLRRVA